MKKKLKKVTICVVRISNDILKDSTPCEDCRNIIQKFNVKKIIYSDKNGEIITKKIGEKICSIKSKARSKI